MSFLKRLFGKSNPEADRRVEEEVAQIESGAIDKVYPIFKPGSWVGLQYGAFHQNFLGTGDDRKLVIAFGYDAPTNFVFLMPNHLEGKDPAQIIKDAYENLEKAPSRFERVDALQGKVLAASGHDFASEKILCRSHMLRAHELLGADELLVSIPRRTCMMITSRHADADLINTFAALHQHTWNDDSYGNAPIINALFLVKDGLIESTVSLGDA